MTPKEQALKRFNHYLTLIPLNQELSVGQEVAFAKSCVISECEEILIACNGVYNSDLVHFRETADGEWWLKVITEANNLN